MPIVKPMPALPRRAPVLASSQIEGFEHRRGWRRQANFWFAASLALYWCAALWIALDVGYFWGDALSRTQGALSALYSRTPTLSAIGYVFTPLTTVLQIPLVALSPWVPEFTRAGLAGALVSSVFMAASVRQLWLIASERNIRYWLAVVGLLLYALNPMIILYGATGMSEAPFIYATLWAVRRLIRWTSTDDVHDLITCGFALALAFLARYDALIMAFVAMWTVGFMTWRARYRRDFRDRIGFALVDMLLLVWPIGFAFVAWTGASWLTTGELFAQFTSTDGNAAIIAASGGGDTGPQALFDASVRTFLISPALLLVAAVAVFSAYRRRDPEPIIPLALIGSVVFFQIITYSLGSTFGLLRFFLTALPLTIILLFQIIPPRHRFPSLRPGACYRDRVTGKYVPKKITGVLVLAIFGGTGITLYGMSSANWAPQEYAIQELVFNMGSPSQDAVHTLSTFSTEMDVADFVDSLNLGDGEVLLSTTYGFAVLTASNNQKQFIIPSDEDFITTLNEPAEHGVKYILALPREGRGATDPINLRYPDMYETGSHIATMEIEFINQGQGQPNWRLYRVLTTPEQS